MRQRLDRLLEQPRLLAGRHGQMAQPIEDIHGRGHRRDTEGQAPDGGIYGAVHGICQILADDLIFRLPWQCRPGHGNGGGPGLEPGCIL